MPTEQDFLRVICAAPDDDGPRLVYADWLDDHEQPERAEFIRVQIELSRTPHLPAKRLRHLRERSRWLAGRCPAPQVVHTVCEVWDFRRGFVEAITLDWPACRDHLDALLRVTPVRQVRLTSWPEVQSYVGAHGRAFYYVPGRPQVEVQWGADPRERVRPMLEAYWPGIAFELPSEATTSIPPDEGARRTVEHARRVGERLGRQHEQRVLDSLRDAR